MDKGDRGALIALGMVLFAIVIIAIFAPGPCNPTDQIVEQYTQKCGGTQDTQGQSVETAYWGLFTARDTLAQWIAGLAAIGSVAVSIWAVRLVRVTLNETRKTTNAAIKAADAASEANNVSREMGEAQVRAYLFCKSGIFEVHSHYMSFAPTLYNTGQSPARNISIKAKVRINEANIVSGVVYSETSEGGCSSIPAGGQEPGYVVWLIGQFQPKIFDRIWGGPVEIEIVGKVKWLDVFDRQQEVVFSFHSDPAKEHMSYDEGEAVRMGELLPRHQEPLPRKETD